jgi:hypothetical protein
MKTVRRLCVHLVVLFHSWCGPELSIRERVKENRNFRWGAVTYLQLQCTEGRHKLGTVNMKLLVTLCLAAVLVSCAMSTPVNNCSGKHNNKISTFENFPTLFLNSHCKMDRKRMHVGEVLSETSQQIFTKFGVGGSTLKFIDLLQSKLHILIKQNFISFPPKNP